MARFSTLYSGSSGNSAVIEEDGKYLLIDMGKSCRMTNNSLKELGLDVADLQGILVTHEHIDHISGLKVFLKKSLVPVYSSGATLDVLTVKDQVPVSANLQEIGKTQQSVGDFGVTAFSTSHDAMDCHGYRIVTPKGKTMCIATDLGYVSHEVHTAMSGADLVALESNYDPSMLQNGAYPYSLKMRIAGKRGHLSNQECAGKIVELAKQGCDKFWLCHLSYQNNTPFAAKQTVANRLEQVGIEMGEDVQVRVARRDMVSDWMEF